MSMTEFVGLVDQMRRLQRTWIKKGGEKELRLVRRLEKTVDEELAALVDPDQEGQTVDGLNGPLPIPSIRRALIHALHCCRVFDQLERDEPDDPATEKAFRARLKALDEVVVEALPILRTPTYHHHREMAK